MALKRGRPKGEKRRNQQIHVTATSESIRQLDYLTEMTGESKAEIIEKAIRIKYNLHNYGSDFDEK